MARIRTIKPAFFRDWDLYQLEVSSGFPTRVAFAGLWTVADRDGRFEWKPRELKPDVLPHDDVDFGDVLNALERGGFVRRYEVSGKAYGLVRSWAEHQRPRQDEEASKLPPPVDSDGSVPQQTRGKERKGKEGEGERNGESAEPLCDSPPSSPEIRVRSDDGPVILAFPVVGAGGPEWRLRRRQVEEWQGLFPGLDVLAECRKALAWLGANPGRRKTAKGMPKFLVGWMSRTVDRRGASPPVSATAQVPAEDRECRHQPRCNSPQWHMVMLARERGDVA